MKPPIFLKRDEAKPCIFCEKRTLYTLRGTGERVHRECWQANAPARDNGSATEGDR